MKKEQEKSVNNIDEAIRLVEKTYGKGALMKLGDRPKVDVNVIPSGSLLIDKALGVGGYPRGRIIEIFGPHMPIENMAEELKTIPHEIMSLITPRVTRLYKENNQIIEKVNERL